MKQELKDFIKMSKYLGERFDIVQAGGGNTSVKLSNGTMLIKASGVYLSDIEENYGYAQVENDKVLSIFENVELKKEIHKRKKDAICSKIVNESNKLKEFRPSIETLLHSMMKKYTAHTHPIAVNIVCCRKNWKEILRKIDFGNYNIAFVNYKTPGIELAVELKQTICNTIPDIVFLQNHGLIVTADTIKELERLQEFVLDALENYININLKKYKLTNKVSKKINDTFQTNLISLICEDEYLEVMYKTNPHLYMTKPFCPDKMVYCGVKVCDLDNNKELELYKENFFEYPKVVTYKNHLFFIAKNIKKAKEIMDVFKFHTMSIIPQIGEINYLSDEEITYIGNWEAEKYRQKI